MTNTYTITKNEQFNSIEIFFNGKPSEAIRDALKALRFRWHNVKKCWYGYADEATTRAALDGCGDQMPGADNHDKQNRPGAKKSAARLASLWDRCDVSQLPGYGTDNELKKTIREEARAAGSSYDKAVAAYIRKHLRERFPECKFSVTSGGAGYLNAVNIDIKSSPYVRELVKGDLNNIDYHKHWDHYENSAELDAILNYCNALYNAFDADDGDYYADYGAHHDLYGSVKIDYNYTQTEPTAEQAASAADFAERKAEFEAAEAARRAAEWEEREKQMEQERAEAERIEAIRTEQAAEIVAHVEVKDLEKCEQIAVIGLLAAVGKECNLTEVYNSISERHSRTDAVISRKISFADKRIFDNFCNMFLYDWEFLAGKGGTATEDVRVNIDNIDKLNKEQRETVKFFACDCIGVYFNGDFQFVIDPQGYSYARHILMPDDDTDSYCAAEKLDEWREESEQLPEMHFPLPIAEQITYHAGLRQGEQITILHLDPWTITATTTAATLNSVKVTDYAQYKGAAMLEITPIGSRKPQAMYITPGQECAIFHGIIPDAPNSLKYTDCGGNLQRVNYSGEGARGYMIKLIEYYKSIGIAPAVDTIQR